MEGINKRYNLKIEILTPLSIGAGSEKDWVRGIDYVVDREKRCLYKLNIKKLISKGYSPDELSNYFVNRNEDGLRSKLRGNLNDVVDAELRIPTFSDNDIKSFVKNQFSAQPVVTGSSLKGAIRSVLYKELGGKNGIGEKDIFGTSENGDEFMRFIKCTDADFKCTELVNTKIFNLHKEGNEWLGGWKNKATDREGNSHTEVTFKPNGFNTLYESLVPEQISAVSIMMSELLYEQFEKEVQPHKIASKKKFVISSISGLFSLINKHTRDYLQKEKAFFEKYNSAEKTDKIIAAIDYLLKLIPQDNSYCVLKMSVGSGFHSITGDWQFDDYSENNPNTFFNRKGRTVGELSKAGKYLPKSRKIAEYKDRLTLMGFVKLTPISEDEYQDIIADVHSDFKIKLDDRQKALEVEKEKTQNEIRIRKEYETLISEAEILKSSCNYCEAMAKLNNAAELYPNGSRHDVLRLELVPLMEMMGVKKNKDALQRRIEEARMQKSQKGLAVLNEKYELGPNIGAFKVTTFKVCMQKVNSWLKCTGLKAVPNNESSELKSALLRICQVSVKKEADAFSNPDSTIWKQVALWVGEDLMHQWFYEIVKS